MRRSGLVSGSIGAVIALVAVFAAEAPAWSASAPSPEPSAAVTASPAPTPTPSAIPSAEPSPTPAADPAPSPDTVLRVDAVMGAMDAPTTGSIAVSVTEWATGAVATDGCVEVYDAAGAVTGSSCTPVAGVFTVEGLAAGSYKVRAYNQAGMVPMWFGPAASRTAASAVAVSDGAATPIAIRVVPPYSVVGKVVDGAGNAIAGGLVDAWYGNPLTFVASTTVGDDGTYVLTSSGCTSWCKVRFAATPGHPQQWYVRTDVFQNVVVTVAGSAVVASTQVHSALPGSIVGTISVPTYFQSEVVCLVLGSSDPSVAAELRTSGVACGHRGDPFEFTNLSAPSYGFKMCAVDAASAPEGCTTSDVVNEYGSRNSGFFETRAGVATTAVLDWGSTLTVTVSTSFPIVGGCIELWTDAGALQATVCDPPGGVASLRIENDTLGYRVRVRGVPGVADTWLDSSYYEAAAPGSSISPIRVSDGAPASISERLSGTGTVSGTVTLPSGTTSTRGCVKAFDVTRDPTTGDAGSVCADPVTGAYVLRLALGVYRLEYSADGTDVATRWSGDVADSASAELVQVTSSSQRTINMSLQASGGISVSMEDSHGVAVTSGCVRAANALGATVTRRCFAAGTDLILDGLASGSYSLHFDGADGVAPMWWGGDVHHELVAVTTGVTTPVHFTVNEMGSIHVDVTAAGGGTATGGCVTAFASVGGSIAGSACADHASSGVDVQVPAGDYRLFLSDWADDAALVDSWALSGSPQSATVVSVLAGSTATVSSALARGTGTLHVAPTFVAYRVSPTQAKPATDGCAWAYDGAGNLAAVSCADAGGASVDLHLKAGQYKVYFSSWIGSDFGVQVPLAPEWSGSVNGFDTAAAITVDGVSTATYAPAMVRQAVLTGTISHNGVPVTGGVLEVYDRESGELLGEGLIGSSGRYSVDQLRPGTHIDVKVRDVPGFVDQTPVTVGTYSTELFFYVSDFDYELVGAGRIQGVITAPPWFTGTEVCAEVWKLDGGYWRGIPTDADVTFVDQTCGSRGDDFAFPELPAGYYALSFTDGSSRDWYGVSESESFLRRTVYENQVLDLFQDEIQIWSPNLFVWGTDVPIGVTQLHPVDGTFGADLTVVTQSGAEGHFTASLVFAGGNALVVLRTDQGGASQGGIYLNLTLRSGLSAAGRYMNAVVPAVTLSGPGSVIWGTTATYSVSVDPSISGVASLQYSRPGGTWTTSTKTVTVTDGVGSFTLTPVDPLVAYRVVILGSTSNEVPVTAVAPVVTLSGPSSVVQGATATYTVSVDPTISGVASLQYSRPGGAWTTSTKTVTMTNGAGSFTLTPVDPIVTYRVVIAGSTSNAIGVAAVAPVVTLSGPSSVVWGTTTTYTVAVSSPITGVAALQYSRPGGAWTTSTKTVTMTNGAGSFTLTPVDPMVTYRVVIAGSTSNAIGVAAVAPTVTLSGPSSVVWGTTTTYTVAVSSPISGVASLQYSRPGGAWTTSTKTVTVTNGAGSFTLTPLDPMVTYRVVIAGSTSNAIPVAAAH